MEEDLIREEGHALTGQTSSKHRCVSRLVQEASIIVLTSVPQQLMTLLTNVSCCFSLGFCETTLSSLHSLARGSSVDNPSWLELVLDALPFDSGRGLCSPCSMGFRGKNNIQFEGIKYYVYTDNVPQTLSLSQTSSIRHIQTTAHCLHNVSHWMSHRLLELNTCSPWRHCQLGSSPPQ